MSTSQGTFSLHDPILIQPISMFSQITCRRPTPITKHCIIPYILQILELLYYVKITKYTPLMGTFNNKYFDNILFLTV